MINSRLDVIRKAIISEIDKNLKRLGTDYVDLYIIHGWDYNTPIEETMEALHYTDESSAVNTGLFSMSMKI